MISKRTLCFYFLLAFISACAQKPTKVNTKVETPASLLVSNASGPVKVTPETIVVDARKRFEYQMAHYPGSVHLRWESFTDPRNPLSGQLLDDNKRMVQRLALKGVHPRKAVIVIGEGRQGDASAARLAWTLFYYGVENVSLVGDSVLKLSSNIQETLEVPKNQELWDVPENRGMLATKDEVLKAASDVSDSGVRKSVIIDTRSEREYFKKKGFGKQYALPDLGALNIEWVHFYNEKGRPELSMRDQLKSVGVSAKTKVILISDRGVRSAAVHFALLSMGFKTVKTYVDGYSGLLK